ncbi:hypothetical protein [Solimicrobium silvestre]|uniref:hypothetical protein n=1 Tax=Solimicrobium silvestre TaxID=2099400 RepID=UPI0013FD4054|nr:hypothetical protein [Solimicrobium silvestre]
MMSIRGEAQAWYPKETTVLVHSRFVVNQAETMIDAAVSGAGLARPPVLPSSRRNKNR